MSASNRRNRRAARRIEEQRGRANRPITDPVLLAVRKGVLKQFGTAVEISDKMEMVPPPGEECVRIDFRDDTQRLIRLMTITHKRGSSTLFAATQITRIEYAEVPASAAVATVIQLLEPIRALGRN